MCQRSMVIVRRLEPDEDGATDGSELLRKVVIVLPGRYDGHLPAPAAFRSLDENLLPVLGHVVDGYQHGASGVEVSVVMVGRPPKCCLDNLTLDTCWLAQMKPAAATRPCLHLGRSGSRSRASQCAMVRSSSQKHGAGGRTRTASRSTSRDRATRLTTPSRSRSTTACVMSA